MKTYAWYFPNWHRTVQNDKWHGTGWTEWQCVKYATPRFEGHLQPKKPLWGYEDESDPKVMEKKIKTLTDYGVNGFIFDYYWFKEEGPYRRDCLEKGFLGAKNNEDVEFSVMWCNHDPIYVHPAPYRSVGRVLASGDVDEAFVKEVTDYCIENYFCKKNYMRVDGKIFFGIWDMTKFINNFGSAEEAGRILADFRKRAADRGYELHLASHCKSIPGYHTRNKEEFNGTIATLGLDSLFTYGGYMPVCKEWPKVEYSEYTDYSVEIMKSDTELSDVPLATAVSTGWDSSPRTVQSEIYEEAAGWPYCPVTVNNTPEAVEVFFKKMKDFFDSGKSTAPYLTLATWNEWTEGNFFEPCEMYGFGYLEAFKKIFR